MFVRSFENSNDLEQQKLAQFLTSYADVFSKSDPDKGQTDLVEHAIDTGDAPPVRQRPRRFPFAHRQASAETLKTLLDNCLVRECQSLWASNIVLVKKPDNSLRLCLDYRDLNKATRFDAYPHPRLDEALQILRGATYYHGLDLASGYWQTRMRTEDREKNLVYYAVSSRRDLLLTSNAVRFSECRGNLSGIDGKGPWVRNKLETCTGLCR